MPVSHLGLTVSHIPSATSFYLTTLQPLGYHYIGQSGDSVGLGVHHADLFLTQEPRGAAVSPTHIAFTAESRLIVRNCYSAALNAGGYPSGAPSYRESESAVFNAAVEDLDGNVIEFVYREGSDSEEEQPAAIAPPEDSRVLTWQKNVARSGFDDDAQSQSSRVSRAKSRAQTVMTLASSTSKSTRSQSAAPTPGISRAVTMPVSSTTDFPSKAFLGTVLGAAAGAAIAYAMTRAEEDNARNETAFAASTRSRSATRVPTIAAPEPEMHRNFSVTESRASRAPKSHRNFSVTESAFSRRYPPRSIATRSIRAIEPAKYDDDDEVQEAISRYTSSRRPPAPQRSKTIDAIEYTPMSNAGRSSRHTAKDPSTYSAIRPDFYLEAPKPKSTASRHSTRRSTYDDDQEDLKRRDSGVSMSSHRSQHTADAKSHASRRSSASTVKQSRHGSSHHQSAAEVPLPASKAPTYVSVDEKSHASRRSSATTVKPVRHAPEQPLPCSITRSFIPSAQISIPEPRDGADYAAEESDGLGDSRTVVPDDSISCIDLPSKMRSSRSSHKSSRHGSSASRRSEAAGSDRTVRPAKKEGSRHSAATMPVRSREESSGTKSGKRSTFSYT